MPRCFILPGKTGKLIDITVAAVAADADAATIAGKVNELITSLKAAGVIA